MAHFAKLDENNKVVHVEAVNNAVITDENGTEQESLGIAFLRDVHKEPTATWKQTSYNTMQNKYYTNGGGYESSNLDPDQSKALRGNFAKIDGTYDSANDVFYSWQPFPSWILDTETWIWEAPNPPGKKPDDGKPYNWDESAYQSDNNTGWIEVV